MRDYINPSLDTTISTTGQIIKLLADNPDQWQRLRKDPTFIPNAVSEAITLSVFVCNKECPVDKDHS